MTNGIVAYIADQQVWCPACVVRQYVPLDYINDTGWDTCDHEGQPILAMHSGQLFETQPCCAGCDRDIEGVVVMPFCRQCGVCHPGQRHVRRSMKRDRDAVRMDREVAYA